MERLLGRCYVQNQDVVKYLVAYEGFVVHVCRPSNCLMVGF